PHRRIPMFFINAVRSDCLRVSKNFYSHFFQNLRRDGSSRHSGDGLPARRTAAAPVIPETIFAVKGIIRMSRTINVHHVGVILRTLVFIKHYHGNRRSRGLSLKDSRENLHLVALISLGGIPGLSRFSSV